MSITTKDVIELIVNSFPESRRPKIRSILLATTKQAEYYKQHQEEKSGVIKKANELFEDWKKARAEYIIYHNYRKGRRIISGPDTEQDKEMELYFAQNKKSIELLYFCLNHPTEETLNIMARAWILNGETPV